jgi:hypothetical protein
MRKTVLALGVFAALCLSLLAAGCQDLAATAASTTSTTSPEVSTTEVLTTEVSTTERMAIQIQSEDSDTHTARPGPTLIGMWSCHHAEDGGSGYTERVSFLDDGTLIVGQKFDDVDSSYGSGSNFSEATGTWRLEGDMLWISSFIGPEYLTQYTLGYDTLKMRSPSSGRENCSYRRVY